MKMGNTIMINLKYNDILVMEFYTVDDAESFYEDYVRADGFRVRLSNIDHDSEGRLTRRKWVCEKEDSRPQKIEFEQYK